jgi:hypothetical protein
VSVYGPNSDRDRRLLWDELAGLLSWRNLPWCIGGNFNVIRFPRERSGEAHLCPAMVEFSDFNFDQGLMDHRLPCSFAIQHKQYGTKIHTLSVIQKYIPSYKLSAGNR